MTVVDQASAPARPSKPQVPLYLVMGLGDVYLGAPVATPLDPRHRLVTTKYNPARTWTPENAVGIGGAYLCVYGMEGPGGYQFVGRTLQMWNRYRQTDAFRDGKHWLLRFFDQLRFYPVSAVELERLRADFPYGKAPLRIEPTRLRLRDYRRFLEQHAESIGDFKARQQAAFDAERERWRAEPLELDAAERPAAGTARAAAVDGTVRMLRDWHAMPPEGRREMGLRAEQIFLRQFTVDSMAASLIGLIGPRAVKR